uniref:Uncharacterized protein n=1 Tax=Panagrolaimus davidi TaxID=227884 RepID=A0A914R5N1_9BILA
MLKIKAGNKPALIVNNPTSVILNCQRFRQKSRRQSIECKIDLLQLEAVLLQRLDNFLTSYQAFSLLISSRQLYVNYHFTVGEIKLNQIDTHRFSISDSDWDDNLTFYKSSRDLSIMIKQSQLLPNILYTLLYSKTKKFRPKKLMIKNSNLPWYFIKEIAIDAVHFELETSTITELPKFTQLLRFFNYARIISIPDQTINVSKQWLNCIANWHNTQSAINIDINVCGIDLTFDVEKLYRFFKGRTSCVIKATINLPESNPPLLIVKNAIDKHISSKFLEVKYNQIPSYYLKIILQKPDESKFDLEYVPRC